MMNDREKIRFLLIVLTITTLFEFFMILGFLDLLNDKNNYILNLTDEKQELTDKYGDMLQKYIDKKHELDKYQRKYGEIE